MSKHFQVELDIDRIVTQKVSVLVEAVSEEAAIESAKEAVSDWPNPSNVAEVKRIRGLKSTYWIPKSIELKSVERMYKNGEDFNNPRG